ncbi:MAG TPA: hypothetical protein V6D18_18980 [Thermosynechococcaceae cyanobacterium]
MTDIHHLLNQLSSTEDQLRSTQFLAPCVKGGQVRIRIAGLVYTFTPQPRSFAGWGVFQPIDSRTAVLVETAELPQVTEYLQHFPAVRLRLATRLQEQAWLAYPVNKADLRQRFKTVRPVAVHLVTEGSAFEEIVARWQEQSCWFEEIDRRADPTLVELLQAALKNLTPVESLQFKGLTPEMRSTYELVAQRTEGLAQPHQDERRLRQALQMGGGELQQFHDRGDYWTVEWTTATGERHISAISKTDLTVVSSGICLSGYDRDFDLQSLVGVIEGRD